MWQVIVFVAASLVISYISRRSLANLRSHGFYRFFAWELMLALLVLNVPHWFENPTAWYQVIAWFLLMACILPLVLGMQALRSRGRQDAHSRTEPELLGFERTTNLVTDGVYHYIRHPLYSSLFLLDWGIFFKLPSWLGFLLAGAAALLLVATARADEAECIATFGPAYRQYMHETHMFIPYIL